MHELPSDRTPWAGLRRALGLCGVAGYVDAFGYFVLGTHIFAANMTGNTVFAGTGLATGLASGDWDRAAMNASAIAVFCVGAVVADVLAQGTGRSWAGILLAACILISVQFLPLPALPLLLLLALAMGAQGASLRRFGPARLQTVVITGTLLRFSAAMVSRLRQGTDQPERSDGNVAVITLSGWIAYAGGAAVGIVLGRVVTMPLLLPAAMLLLLVTDVAFRGN